MAHDTALPQPGLGFATYAQRDAAPPPSGSASLGSLAWWLRRTARAAVGRRSVPLATLPATLRQAFDAQHAQLQQAGDGERPALLAATRARLRREGLSPIAAGAGLAVAADAARRTLGLTPYPTQLLAAWLLLDGRFAEMATGEGKTLAMGLAAAVAGLAGVPVHVLTANDYLAARDQELLAPLYSALGIASGVVVAATPAAQRPAQWRQPIVHSTAREVGFDYLRDHQSLGGERDPRCRRALALAGQAAPEPRLPGLHMALLDEADNLLLDEATVPLLLAQSSGAADAPLYRRAWAFSAGLAAQRHFHLLPEMQRAPLTPEGRHHVAAAAATPQVALQRRFCDLVEAALVARHLLQRERHYLVNAEAKTDNVMLIDEPTGRIAAGRRWSGHLYPMVQVKEGLTPAAPAQTSAQITFPRLFGRYLRLAGVSGTLAEAAPTLQSLYRVNVERVPLAKPLARRELDGWLFTDPEVRWQAVVRSVRQRSQRGQPVLVGVDSVQTAAALSRRLAAAGIAHQRLDATQDQVEASLVARAGSAGRVTVATNMAGRGTDIALDAAARAAGGLHVIATVRHRSRRVDRQFHGRSGRQGDPGSCQDLLALDDALLAAAWPPAVLGLARRLGHLGHPGGWGGAGGPRAVGRVPPALAAVLLWVAQRGAEWADSLRRRHLARTEHESAEMLGFAGASE